jgi:tRNA U34 5-methylaminomethyl-2-thiouridine-forming methyltransferase MnmC
MPSTSNIKHIITKDGSSTLYAPDFDEHYHSLHGAIQESMYVFIEKGLRQLSELKEVSVLEMGFGTGLNALLTYIEAPKQKIKYTSIELYPLQPEQVKLLNYAKELAATDAQSIFEALHEAEWESFQAISPNFQLKKVQAGFEHFQTDAHFDLVYFDAFAPAVQPDLWSDEIMQRMYDLLNPGGVFVTYSAKGSVKRGLIKAGFDGGEAAWPSGEAGDVTGAEGVDGTYLPFIVYINDGLTEWES